MDALADLIGRQARIDHHAALRLAGRAIEIGLAHTLHESQCFGFEAIGIAAALRTREPDAGVDVENQGQIGTQIAEHHLFDRRELVRLDAAARALISPARIDESIADHVAAALQRRQHRRLQMRGARREDQQQFRDRSNAFVPVREHEPANRLGQRRAARLARRHHLAALRPQPGGDETRLRGLAGALAAFERDEPAARGRHQRWPPRNW